MSRTTCDVINTVYSGFTTLIGLSGFVVFTFVWHNIQAGIWAFVSGVFASITLLIHVLHILERLPLWYGYDQLFSLGVMGVLGFSSGLIALVAYVILGVTTHEGVPSKDTLSGSYFIMSIWAGIAMKCAGFLAFFSRSFLRRGSPLHVPLNS